ncbi:MAG: hypothetical protein LBT57_02555 [Puniceicoccales bacterium]|nr:hypothetical protein [Puniceicoccales bacterium]
MSKIRNISLFCALLSAGFAGADDEHYLSPKLGPILSADKTHLQLNFPQEIVDKLNKFIAGVKGHERYGAFLCIPSSNNSLRWRIQKEFWMTIGAMAPYINMQPEKRESLLSSENLVRTAQTLLSLHDSKIFIPALLVIRIQIALDYFLSDNAGVNDFPCRNCPRNRKRLNPTQQVIEEYKSSLEVIASDIVNRSNTRS